jgi:hypothetical protein
MQLFNSEWVVNEPIDVDVAMLPRVTLKDADYGVVVRQLPEYAALLKHLFSLIPKKRYSLVDISFGAFKAGSTTCKDTGWHIDGKMNKDQKEDYVIWCDADDGLRTAFYKEPINYQRSITQPTSIAGRHALFESILKHSLLNEAPELTYEIPRQTPVSYRSFDFHKGRVATDMGERVFIRVMTSDVIRPRHNRQLRGL